MLLKIQDCLAYTLNNFRNEQAKGLLVCTDNSMESSVLLENYKDKFLLLKTPPLEIVDFANGAAISGRSVLTVLHSQDKHNEIIKNILDLSKTLHEKSFKHINILINNDFSDLNISSISEIFNSIEYKIFLPSNPYDFCSLLKISLESEMPSFFLISPDIFEVQGPIPNFTADPLSEANATIRKQANDISIIGTGEDIFQACDYANNISLDAEIIETRVISPIDYKTLTNSISKTKQAKIIQTNNYLNEFNLKLCEKLRSLCADANISIEKVTC